ncbi:exodeoxyribonuclease VII large subunit [uncultured Clostridium sp.]|jgi:exodeoxyribonuclease VII large subunit|uniref:exodeoxyribonuclease VII large subunit n=1 Tax=uncultured Clostridium sp. TaxID=59620 RepID=UPI00261A63CB|nr:exodeoxyribonuclease VII large subunit [uncultured Clostridium sp.]
MKLKTLTVTEASNYLKRIIDNDFIMNNLSVKGEVSNLKFHSSGHIYFSLKDGESKINCVMFKSDAVNLNFLLENGMEVSAKARLSVYIKEGSYQLYCREISSLGIGELFEKFEKMKKELEREGIFESAYKRAISKFPKRIGVITSPTGAAVRDIIQVIKRRNPNVDVIIYPAKVQGIGAADTLIDGIQYFNRKSNIDTIIIGRGGGSIEELWAFNDKELAYEIFNSKIPVISAVGHETDFTICDFASDLRAATPSAAAEISVPIIDDEKRKIKSLESILNRDLVRIIERENINLAHIGKILENNHPSKVLERESEKLNNFSKDLNRLITSKIDVEKNKIITCNKVLTSMNPLNVLDRGFSIISNEDGKVLNTIKELTDTEKINIKMTDGEARGLFEILK